MAASVATLDGVPPAARAELAVREVTKRFGRLPVLEGVSLTVRRGELVALVGENGAGKTTLVRCVAGDVGIDAGEILVAGHPVAASALALSRGDVAVVWQDLALCPDLDVVGNAFLGRERARVLLAESQMHADTRAMLERLGCDLPDLRVRVAALSRAQRQQVALARALLAKPRVLVLDEPTAALGAGERRRFAEVLGRCRRRAAVLLVTHDLAEAFALADRIVVLREGRVVAEVSPMECHPDDVAAMMSGIEADSMARRQLHRLGSLVDQLSIAAPSASLPIIVSATAAALDQEMLCVHLLEERDGTRVLCRSAAVGLPPALLEVTDELPVGEGGGSVGLAAATGELVAAEDVWEHPAWAAYRDAARACGVRSAWAAPIVGSHGVLGAISGYGTGVGRPPADRLELVSLYASHAAAAIEREHLLAEVTRRNRILESLRGLLETLAGPQRDGGGLSVALLALCRGLGADAAGVLIRGEPPPERWTVVALRDRGDRGLRAVAGSALSGASERACRLDGGLACSSLPLPDGRGVVVARWPDPSAPTVDALALLEDASRSIALAIERESLESARREAAAARRSQTLQRELLLRLSHELRTPLTAIHGYASTLQQPDLTWDAGSTERFLAAIAAESARMQRLVDDLLDSSAIESGLLRLQGDWADLGLLLEAARSCVARSDDITLDVEEGLEPIWADHDRLEQVFVNLFDNAVRHGSPDGEVATVVRRGEREGTVEIVVRNHGPDIAPEVLERVFEPRVRGRDGGAGLGLAIARGIVEAHGGSCAVRSSGGETAVRIVLPTERQAAVERGEDASWELFGDDEGQTAG